MAKNALKDQQIKATELKDDQDYIESSFRIIEDDGFDHADLAEIKECVQKFQAAVQNDDAKDDTESDFEDPLEDDLPNIKPVDESYGSDDYDYTWFEKLH